MECCGLWEQRLAWASCIGKKGATSFEMILNPCCERIGKRCISPWSEAGGASMRLQRCERGSLWLRPAGQGCCSLCLLASLLLLCSQCPELLTKVMGLCGNFVGINICLSAGLGPSVISHVPFGSDISKQN